MFGEDFEKAYGYDSSICYEDVLQEYKAAAASGDEEKVSSILNAHGGIIALCGKAIHQKFKGRNDKVLQRSARIQ